MRLGINIPNNLYKRMSPIKDRVNISQICREAIERWVTAYESSLDEIDEDIRNKVDQLNLTWEPYVVDWEEVGRNDAKVWAKRATPEQFEIFAYNLKVGRGHGRIPGVWMAPIIPDTPFYGQRRGEHEQWFIEQFDANWDTNHHETSQEDYECGWTSYLIALLNLAVEDETSQ